MNIQSDDLNKSLSHKDSGYGRIVFILSLLVFAISLVSLMIGRIYIEPVTILKVIVSDFFPVSKDWSPTIESVVMNVRLPRLIAGLLVGAGLSISGAAFQGLFRNPLVSPHILGVSAGAGFGAALGILLFNSLIITQIFSFVFGIIAVCMAYMLSRVYRTSPMLVLVLAGVIVGSLFSALTSFIKYIADPMNRMPAIVFWLMGSLNNVSNKDLLLVMPVFVICITCLIMIRWRINVLSMGEDDARALGINTEKTGVFIIVCATVITAASVCISGIIGWIGLVIPHVGRLIVGPDHRHLLPVSLLIGAGYLVVVDTITRSLMITEIPIGILTALIGAPFFALLLKKNRPGW
ncbi:MAG TPA: iron ABC transporter permease [Spirochaetota bacterium]|nr:iron ABC transporter permease [Spirochaetota bacterium]HPJ33314.1 iron ABC transporter permease [Spirochaetota bacterium]